MSAKDKTKKSDRLNSVIKAKCNSDTETDAPLAILVTHSGLRVQSVIAYAVAVMSSRPDESFMLIQPCSRFDKTGEMRRSSSSVGAAGNHLYQLGLGITHSC